MLNGLADKKNTLCEHCGNACNGGCCWTDHFEPVEGWVAQKSKINLNGLKGKWIDSFIVVSCPEFIEEEPIEAKDINDEGVILMMEALCKNAVYEYVRIARVAECKKGVWLENEISTLAAIERGLIESPISCVASAQDLVDTLRFGAYKATGGVRITGDICYPEMKGVHWYNEKPSTRSR